MAGGANIHGRGGSRRLIKLNESVERTRAVIVGGIFIGKQNESPDRGRVCGGDERGVCDEKGR